MPITVVTDSAATIPADIAERHHIEVVPLSVVVDGTAYDEGDGISSGGVAAALRDGATVSTSRPTPEALVGVYNSLAAHGATHIVSVHLSESLSGTVESAQLAARRASVDVTVIDSRTLGMAMGFAALAGAGVAARTGDVDSVVAAVNRSLAGCCTFFGVDDLTYLRRGGRIGKTSAMLGSALSIKPLLHLSDGRVEPLERVRTSAKATSRLVALAVDAATRIGGPVELSVQHLDARDRAEQLAERLAEEIEDCIQLWVVEIGAALGAHVGPGTIGVSVNARA